MPENNISYKEFAEIIKSTQYMNCQEIIKLHQEIKNKELNNNNESNLGVIFIYRLLDCNYGKLTCNKFPEEYEKFFNSNYFSEYFKEVLKLESNLKIYPELYCLITSSKQIYEYTKEELEQLDKYFRETKKENTITALALHLYSTGAIEYLNDETKQIEIIKRIIMTSGLFWKPEYYSGRGAKKTDLDGKRLYEVYLKLGRINPKYATSMARITLEMPTLGTTEFLTSLYRLVKNNYDLSKTEVSTKNILWDSSEVDFNIALEISSILTSTHMKQKDETHSIKLEFLSYLSKYNLTKIFQGEEFVEIYGEQGYYKKRTGQ